MIRLNNKPDTFDGLTKYYLFKDGHLLIKKGVETLTVPKFPNGDISLPEVLYSEFLGTDKDGVGLIVSELASDDHNLDGFELQDFRQYYKIASEEEFMLAGYAVQIYQWRKNFKFCGTCGSKMEKHSTERAMQCPNCNHLSFPRISPAVIVAVKKNNKLLLAHNSKFREGLYSVIAGYIEPGETPEEAAKREVKEEVGVDIKNLKYIKSQSWPFPDSLMLGYTAEYESGGIQPDNHEIDDAGWYTVEEFKNVIIPGYHAIARWLIDELFPEIKGINYESK